MLRLHAIQYLEGKIPQKTFLQVQTLACFSLLKRRRVYPYMIFIDTNNSYSYIFLARFGLRLHVTRHVNPIFYFTYIFAMLLYNKPSRKF